MIYLTFFCLEHLPFLLYTVMTPFCFLSSIASAFEVPRATYTVILKGLSVQYSFDSMLGPAFDLIEFDSVLWYAQQNISRFETGWNVSSYYIL
jgi:hypothetical protein